jgi:hypothetical protein
MVERYDRFLMCNPQEIVRCTPLPLMRKSIMLSLTDCARQALRQARHEVSAALAKPVKEIEKALYRLAETHSVVLHPHVCEPWVIHPFSFSRRRRGSGNATKVGGRLAFGAVAESPPWWTGTQ